MIKITFIPHCVRCVFKGIPGVWKGRHLLILYWLVLLQSTVPGKITLKELSRWAPWHMPEWRFRRFLKAGYWTIEIIISWLAMEVINSFPPPKDRTIYLVGDSSHKNKRAENNPVVQKGRENKNNPWFFGIRFILLMAAWDVFRIPFAFKIILPKDHKDYKNENTLFRQMVRNFTPPYWAETIIVIGDAAYCSGDNIKMVKAKNKNDTRRNWFYVFAIARTWKTQDNKSIKDLVTYLPKKFYKCTWINSLTGRKRKVFRVFRKNICLRHAGDVTIVLTKKGRNTGPKKTKMLVTNLPGATARQVIAIYQRRWPVEIIFKELKSALGLGEHQVTKEEDRVEKSLGIAIVAYLFLLRVRKEDIKTDRPWSIFQLQNNFRIQVITNQIEHKMKLEIKNIIKTA